MAAIPTILRGDDSGAITISIASGRSYAGATLVVAYQGVTRRYTDLVAGGTVTLTFTHDETAGFALKTAPLLMRLIGAAGGEETVGNADARIKVTDCLAEVNAGGSFIVEPGGSVTDPTKVPITDVGDMAARYSLADIKAKVDQIVRVLAQRSLLALGGALVLAATAAHGALDVQTARLDSLYNDAMVVTNVSGSSGITAPEAGAIATNTVATLAVTNVNGKTGAVVLTGADIMVDATYYPNKSIYQRFEDEHDALGYHTQDYSNPHKVTAADVGARPDTWLPTVVEIGALSSYGGTLGGALTINGPLTVGGVAHLGDIDHNGSEIVYGISTNGTSYLHADVNLKPFGDGILSQAVTASKSMVGGISNQLEYIEGYMAGQRVRISVTNYYGNSSGELPRLRIEEYVAATNTIGGVETETNYWQTVWDENNKYHQYYTNTTEAVAGMTNNLYQTYYALLQERLNTKAPRAWGTLTSAGEAAPPGTVWHTEPNTVFAGGTEYAHAMVGTGVIGVLTSRGAAIYTDGETGRFHFTTDDKTHYFGMNIASRYELGCDTDGITVTQVGGNHMVELLYNVTMSGKPILYYAQTLTNAWSQITDSTGAAVPGAPVYASWEQSPPAGSEICNINGGASLSGFFKATVEYVGTSKFETNMMADLAGGIIATNQTTNQMQPVEPYIVNGQVLWRVKQ